ncbi:glutathione S-transferase-like protein [Teratosphaeria destructans]|uniref:Glutathione S-transferase-like protein n=1 Tax=Teratosphaeria destructans TaxID=418781 RepID=A0A9W7W2F4_9PEZI|nr:glutathione S-transferase-like protein [Teratosphaeria destructans]
MLTIHHLSISQSERIVWLAEELGLDYTLVRHIRDPVMAPESLRSLPGNTLGKAPFIEDSSTGVTLSESGAIADYIIGRYGNGRLQASPTDDAEFYADYLYWFHWSNGTLQPAMLTSMFLAAAQVDPTAQIAQFDRQRLTASMEHINDRLKSHKWLAGEEFTAADIMTLYCFTTQRYFGPLLDLALYQNVIRWMGDCSRREGYRMAMEKCDPEMQPLLGAKAPEKGLLETGGVEGREWRKQK